MHVSTYNKLRKIASDPSMWGDPMQQHAGSYFKRQWDNATPEQREDAKLATKNFWANSWRVPVNAASEFITRDVPQGAVWLGGAVNGILDPSNSLFTEEGRENINRMLSDIDTFHNNYLRVPWAEGTSQRMRNVNDKITTGLSIAGQMAAGAGFSPSAFNKVPVAVRTLIPFTDDIGNGVVAAGTKFVDGFREGLNQ